MLNNLNEVLLLLLFLSIFVERSLSVIFAQYYYQKYLQSKHIKEIIALVFGYIICYICDFDVLSKLFMIKPTIIGMFLTSLCIAGGAKLSIKVFQDWFNTRKVINANN